MTLERCVELLERSSNRMVSAMRDLQHDRAWLIFMRREVWWHLQLTIKTWWKMIWWKGEEEKH